MVKHSTTPGYVGGLVTGHIQRGQQSMDPQRERELQEAAFRQAYDAEPDRRDDRRWFALGWEAAMRVRSSASNAGVPLPPCEVKSGEPPITNVSAGTSVLIERGEI